MNRCPRCNSELNENSSFCRVCGFNVAQQPNVPQMQPGMQQPPYYFDPKDHTREYTPQDISDNKVLAMLPYILGLIGIIVSLLAINHSKYVAFNVKQALKIQVVSSLLGIISLLFCWTLIIPLAAVICNIIIFVVKIICFFNVCKGKAKEAPIISNFDFLK